MTIRFDKDDKRILFRYEPEYSFDVICAKLCIDFDDSDSIRRYTPETLPDELEQKRLFMQDDASVTIKRVFTFLQDDLVDEMCESLTEILVFKFAALDEANPGYFRVNGRVFDCEQDILLATNLRLDWRLFCVGYERRTSVIKRIASMLDDSEAFIAIGGDDERAIPEEAFKELLDGFPTTATLKRYGDAQIESYIQDYLSLKKDYGAQYRRSLERRRTKACFKLGSPTIDASRITALREAATQLHGLLNQGKAVPEESWQRGILCILPVLFPQYVAVIPKAKIKDTLTGKKREVDFLLVDASGNADVLEIKKAFDKRNLLMRAPYRDNKVPARELSGGIMQIEKYIHLLLNWGREGEAALTRDHSGLLPDGLAVRFVNPRGILLMGNCEFDETEQRDFDLIRRQYSHVADIITYPDLLHRLERMIEALGPLEGSQDPAPS